MAIDCIPEVLHLKQNLFVKLEALTGHANCSTIIASNSSSFPVSTIGRNMKNKACISRALNLHFFMPARLVPCVEVVRGQDTSGNTVMRAHEIMKDCKMMPVLVNKEVDGFIGNRLQHALLREAFSLISEGVASAEDIDKVVQYGFGMRYIAGSRYNSSYNSTLLLYYRSGVLFSERHFASNISQTQYPYIMSP
jgi:3-hydroxybutyryl-CoA dehydrogenase